MRNKTNRKYYPIFLAAVVRAMRVILLTSHLNAVPFERMQIVFFFSAHKSLKWSYSRGYIAHRQSSAVTWLAVLCVCVCVCLDNDDTCACDPKVNVSVRVRVQPGTLRATKTRCRSY